MATPLTKPVHRSLQIEGDRYIASLEPAQGGNPPSFALRKMRTSNIKRHPISCLLDEDPEALKQETTKNKDMGPCEERDLKERLKTNIAVSDLDYKLKVSILNAVHSLFSEEAETETETRTQTMNP